MSHDIRTPMNAIMGMTAIAGKYLDDKDRIQDCLAKITTASNHLLNLINEVLDMANRKRQAQSSGGRFFYQCNAAGIA